MLATVGPLMLGDMNLTVFGPGNDDGRCEKQQNILSTTSYTQTMPKSEMIIEECMSLV